MKSILFYEHGSSSVLKYGDFPNPEPRPGFVLVKLKAAALNRLDLWVRNGWPGLKIDYPHIGGADGAGVISAVGEGVSDWQIGDNVVINSNWGCGECSYCLSGKDNLCKSWQLLGETIRGTFCEYINVPPKQLYKLPEGFDFHKAAAAILVYLTAWHLLITRGNLKAGETVLIVGASGGVNTASILISKYIGAKTIVIGSGKEKLRSAESIGADILIDRNVTPEWSKEVFRETGKQGADIVVDNVGTTFGQSMRAAAKGGRILTVGNTGGPKFEIDNRFIFGKNLTIIGSSMGTLKDFCIVMDLISRKKLEVVLDKSYALKDTAQAQDRLEQGEHFGKITLEI